MKPNWFIRLFMKRIKVEGKPEVEEGHSYPAPFYYIWVWKWVKE